MENEWKKYKIIAWAISIIYVGFGTAFLFTSFGTDFYFIDWPAYILLTYPVCFISFCIRFTTEGNSFIIPVIIIQLFMFWSTYKLIFLTLKWNRQKKEALRRKKKM